MLLAREVQAGDFVPREESFGLESGVLFYSPNPALDSLLPTGFAARLKAAADSIMAGTLVTDRAPPR
jgi:hypothetical protein